MINRRACLDAMASKTKSHDAQEIWWLCRYANLCQSMALCPVTCCHFCYFCHFCLVKSTASNQILPARRHVIYGRALADFDNLTWQQCAKWFSDVFFVPNRSNGREPWTMWSWIVVEWFGGHQFAVPLWYIEKEQRRTSASHGKSWQVATIQK